MPPAQTRTREARASLTGSRLCEFEHWPRSTRKPSVYVLFMLAEIYETDVLCLLDLADHESLPQQDRLVLLRRPRAETPFGERVVALMEARACRRAETRTACLVQRGLPVQRAPRPQAALRGGWRRGWMTCWRRAGNWSRSRRQPRS